MSKPEIDAQHELATLIHRNSEIDIRVWAKTMRRYGEALEELVATADLADSGFCCVCDARLTSSAHLCRDAIKVA
jgi:hypothetical protein